MTGNTTPGDLAAASGSVTAPVTLDQLTLRDQLDERRQQRSFKYWVGRIIVLAVVFCLVVIVLATVYSSLVKGTPMQSTLIESFLKSLMDIMHILFGPGNAPGS